ncbi:MAG: hypothetical protein J7J98_07535 [candidate division Zixibacteria bacterium]|nr:hypothetical protein [candidate division Zixibacteria bacterium]
MSEGLRKKIIFATLPLAILWAVFNYSNKNSTAQIETQPVASLQTVAPIANSELPDARFINIEDKQAEPWGEDPFRTSSRRQVTNSNDRSQMAWILGGIIFSHQSPVAFINKQIVRVGDSVDGATVVSINKKSVVLDYRERQITLKLSKG